MMFTIYFYFEQNPNYPNSYGETTALSYTIQKCDSSKQKMNDTLIRT